MSGGQPNGDGHHLLEVRLRARTFLTLQRQGVSEMGHSAQILDLCWPCGTSGLGELLLAYTVTVNYK
jgi:hypothetical protein